MVAQIFYTFLVAVCLTAGSDATVIGSSEYENYCLSIDNQNRPRTCLDLLCNGKAADGVYRLYPYRDDLFSFEVFCDQTTDGGGWTVFQRRMDGWVDFYRNWQNYKLGFGDVNGEHWLGFNQINLLTSESGDELRIDMEAVSNERAYAKYSEFGIGNRSTDYTLSVSGYSGNAGDSLTSWHNGMKFSTFDRQNDIKGKAENCAVRYHGAWWYRDCHKSNLNGKYLNGAHPLTFADGINWHTWKDYHESLKTVEMKFRAQVLG